MQQPDLRASSETLKSLLSQTRKLQSAATSTSFADTGDGLPRIQLGLDQIESQSRRLRTRAARVENAQPWLASDERTGAGAHYLLAGGGVNADELGRTINAVDLKGAFEPLQPLHDADVEGYLRHEHEQSIISSIEEGRRQTVQHFNDRLDQAVRQDWARQKEALFEELRRNQGEQADFTLRSRERARPTSLVAHQASTQSKDPNSPLDTHGRMMRYETAVSGMNAARRDGVPYGIVSALAEACTAAVPDTRGQSLTDTWRLLRHLVGEAGSAEDSFDRQRTLPRERAYAIAYLGSSSSSAAPSLRKSLVSASLKHLQEQFLAHIVRQLELNPLEANLGGDPSVDNKVRAYTHLKYGLGAIPEKRLEIVNKIPIWARLFYLVRCGHSQEALALAHQQESHIRSVDQNWVSHFATWVSSPDRCLTPSQRDRFVADYNQRLRQESVNDPFKAALSKIMGRIDLQRKTAPVAIASVEDWAWLQLMLAVEHPDAAESSRGGADLASFAATVAKYGEAHFDPNGSRPLTFFRMLLMSGQFEKAVLFLEQKPLFQIDAVHFSIALSYYGLLRVSDDASDLRAPRAGPVTVNFARQIQRYTRTFEKAAPQAALQYIYLLCLNADAPPPIGPRQIELCHQFLSDLIMDTKEYAPLLGSINADGMRTEGMIQRDLRLIHLGDSRDFLSKIVKRAADAAQQEKRYQEAVILYHLAGEYEQVVAALNLRLGAALARPQLPDTDAADLRNPVEHARAILAFYDQQPGAARFGTSASRTTCDTLLRLEEMVRYSRANRASQAAAILETVTFLPQGSDLVEIIRKADETKALDDTILRNLDVIILEAMSILHQLLVGYKGSPYGDAARQAQMAAVQARARALTTFAGMLRYRLTPETFAELSRLHVYMH